MNKIRYWEQMTDFTFTTVLKRWVLSSILSSEDLNQQQLLYSRVAAAYKTFVRIFGHTNRWVLINEQQSRPLIGCYSCTCAVHRDKSVHGEPGEGGGERWAWVSSPFLVFPWSLGRQGPFGLRLRWVWRFKRRRRRRPKVRQKVSIQHIWITRTKYNMSEHYWLLQIDQWELCPGRTVQNCVWPNSHQMPLWPQR